jgi:hypothetical protein
MANNEFVEEGMEEEKAFMSGFNEEDEELVCDECGRAIRDNRIVKDFEGEKKVFCSEECLIDYEDTI